MIVISLLYGILFVVYILREYIYIIRKNRIEIISYVRIYYSIINGLFPCIIYFKYTLGDSQVISDIGIVKTSNITITLFFSVVGYIFLSIGYFTRFSDNSKNLFKRKIYIDERKLFNLTFILMLVGFSSLFIWTRAYGSISTFIKQAALIRSGYGEVSNSYAFFKHFAKFVNFSFFIFGSYSLFNMVDKQLTKYRFMLIISTILSFIGSFIFLLCSDSRATFAANIIIIVLSFFSLYSVKKEFSAKKQLLIILLIGIVGFIMTSITSNLANMYRYSEYTLGNLDTNIINRFISEYKFVIQSQNKVVDVLFSSQYKWKLFDDIYGSLISWLPSSLKPFSDPETLWTYNTILLKGTTSKGTLPTDLISASFYLFYLFGPILLPFLVGKSMKYIELRIERVDSIFYKTTLKSLFSFHFLMLVSHYMLRSIVYENMSSIIGIVLVHYLCRGRILKKEN